MELNFPFVSFLNSCENEQIKYEINYKRFLQITTALYYWKMLLFNKKMFKKIKIDDAVTFNFEVVQKKIKSDIKAHKLKICFKLK